MNGASEMIGTHPQPVRYYLRLVAGTFRTVLDVGMLVLGTALVGLAVALLLDGFGLVDVGMGLSTGSMLGAVLVIGVCGGFAFGVASEGGYGASESVRDYPELEVAIGRALGAVLVGGLMLYAAGRLTPLVADMSYPFKVAHEIMRADGLAGLIVVPLLGVPGSVVMRRSLDRIGLGLQLELPFLYVLWALAGLVMFNLPPA